MKQTVKPQRAEDFVYRFIRYRERKVQLHFVVETENTDIPSVRTVHAFYQDKGFRFEIDYQDNSVRIQRFDIVRYEYCFGRFHVRHTNTEFCTKRYF